MNVIKTQASVVIEMSHEEAIGFERFLNARVYGGAMCSTDALVANRVLCELMQEHSKYASAKLTEKLHNIVLAAGVQTQADAELNQLKKPTSVEVDDQVGIYQVRRD